MADNTENKTMSCSNVLLQSNTQSNQETTCDNGNVIHNLLTNVVAAANLDATDLEQQETYSQVSQQAGTTQSPHDHSRSTPDVRTLGETLIRAKLLQDGQVPKGLQQSVAHKMDNNSNFDSNDLEKVIDSVTTKQNKKVDIDSNNHGKHSSLATVNNKEPSEAEWCASMSTSTTAEIQHQQSHSAATIPHFSVLSRSSRPLVPPASAKHSVRQHYGSQKLAGSSVDSFSKTDNAVEKEGSALSEDLLVAVPVDEDEVDAYAVSHDVSQDKVHKRVQMVRARRHSCRLYFGAFLLVAASVMIASIVVIEKNNDGKVQEQETEMTLSQNMTQLIMSIMGADAVLLNDTSSPYAKALTWLLQSNKSNESQATTSTLAQRFYAASFYYDTTSDDDKWTYCNPPNGSSELNQTCFDLLYNTTAQAWLSDSHECEWAGVRCDYHQQIVRLGFDNMNLVGTIPASVAKFPFLKALRLTSLQLEGNISSLTDCHHLTYINFDDNMLSGDLSSVWQNCKLKFFYIINNNITGSLSSQIGNLVDLNFFSLYGNELTGTIPSEVGWLDSIIVFEISNNNFRGEIPWTMQFWSMIAEIYFRGNSFLGSIPTFLGNLNKTLLALDIHGNSFTGTLPDELFHLSELYGLDLSDNELSGTIDARFAQLTSSQSNTSIVELYLSGNRFTGTIPTELGSLAGLGYISLQDNEFTGSIPSSVCPNQFLYPDFELTADCAEDDNGQVKLQCDCCTSCCKAGGTQCEPN